MKIKSIFLLVVLFWFSPFSFGQGKKATAEGIVKGAVKNAPKVFVDKTAADASKFVIDGMGRTLENTVPKITTFIPQTSMLGGANVGVDATRYSGTEVYTPKVDVDFVGKGVDGVSTGALVNGATYQQTGKVLTGSSLPSGQVPYTGVSDGSIMSAATLSQKAGNNLIDMSARYNVGPRAGGGNVVVSPARLTTLSLSKIETPLLSHPDIGVWYSGTGEYETLVSKLKELGTHLPNLFEEDQKLTFDIVKEKGKQLDVLDQNFDDFMGSVQVEKATDAVPYADLLPEDIDILYVGVEHGKTLEAEAYKIVKAVQEKYPGRKVIFATEYLQDTPPTTVEDLLTGKYASWGKLQEINTGTELLAQIGAKGCSDYGFLMSTVMDGVPLVGLEPTAERIATLNRVHPGQVNEFNMDELDSLFGTSPYGMNMRNEAWTKHIGQIRAEHSDAMVIVMGGKEHVDESIFMAVNHKVSEAKSFTLHLAQRESIGNTTSVFSLVADELNEKVATKLGAQDRYIVSFTGEARANVEKLNLYKPLMGADAIIVLP